jgi:hypothetical protein
LNKTQLAHLVDLTRDLPERDQVVYSGPDGTIAITIPMNSNDVVLVKLIRAAQTRAAKLNPDAR